MAKTTLIDRLADRTHKDKALDKVLKDLKKDPSSLDRSGMGQHYKI